MDDVWRTVAYVLGTKLWVGMQRVHPRLCVCRICLSMCVWTLLSRASEGECRAGWSDCRFLIDATAPSALALKGWRCPLLLICARDLSWLDTGVTWPSFGRLMMWTNTIRKKNSRQINIQSFKHKETWTHMQMGDTDTQRDARTHTHLHTILVQRAETLFEIGLWTASLWWRARALDSVVGGTASNSGVSESVCVCCCHVCW